MSGTQTRCWLHGKPLYTQMKIKTKTQRLCWSASTRVTCIPGVRRCWYKAWPLPHYRCHCCYHDSSTGLFKQPWDGSMTPNSVSGKVLWESGSRLVYEREERLSLLWHHRKLSAWPHLSTHGVQGLFRKYHAWGAINPQPFRKTQQKVTEAPIYPRREGMGKERAQKVL